MRNKNNDTIVIVWALWSLLIKKKFNFKKFADFGSKILFFFRTKIIFFFNIYVVRRWSLSQFSQKKHGRRRWQWRVYPRRAVSKSISSEHFLEQYEYVAKKCISKNIGFYETLMYAKIDWEMVSSASSLELYFPRF